MTDTFAVSEEALHELKGWTIDDLEPDDTEVEGLEALWSKLEEILGPEKQEKTNSEEGT